MNQGERRPGDLPDEPAGSRARADAGAPFGAPIHSGRANGGVSAGGPGAANQDDKTQALPPRLVPRPRVRPSKWVVAGLVALAALVIVVPILIYALPGSGTGTSTAPAPVTCAEQNTPCGIAQLYLAAYTASNYETMYQYVSSASQTKFGDPAIRGTNYANAHDYIVKRTPSLLRQAGAYGISASQGPVRTHSATTASVPVHVVMHTIRLGDITQDITLPLVLEKGKWHVAWTPGLVFKGLDDPADPQYLRLVRLTPLDAPRGRILARDGTVLAQDETVYSVAVDPTKITSANAATLATDLDSTPTKMRARYDPGAKQPVHLLTITQAAYATARSDLIALQSAGVIQVTEIAGRVYPFGSDAAAVTGYINAVQDSDLLQDASHYYESTDTKGREGIEAWAETTLRPVKGGELDIIDATSGEPVFTIARRSPAAGADVRTTISAQLQQAAVTQIRKESKAGSAVALDPASGEVLVLASSPMYNPNDFSIGFSDNESVRFNALLPQSPYLDRAVAGQYPIGSLMKVTSLAAALENGIGADHVFDCTGSFLIPGQAHPSIDDSPHGHGDITEVTGLAESCDVVFWTIGVTLNSQNPNLLPNMAKTFGYGSLTHIVGLPDGTEQPGLVPDAAWLKQFNGGDWAPVDAANLAIGQGFFTATPLQIAVVSGAVANGGTRWQPRLVTSIVGPDGAAIATYAATALGKLAVSSDHLAVMQAAMVDVTTMPGATSYGTWNGFPALVAAKTGTAQTSTPIPDALYMCYSPASPLSGPPVKAKIAASAVVEYSGFGDAFAQPVTRAILTAYLAPSGS